MEAELPEALAHVVPGIEPDPELVLWAEEQLLAGHALTDVSADLTAQGWPVDEVEAAVEAARVRTRRERGVVTRDDVAGALERTYRRQTSGLAAFCRSGINPLAIVAFAVGLRQALGSARHLRQLAKRDRSGNS